MTQKILMIIDVQEVFKEGIWGARNNLQAEENIKRLLKVWRAKGWKVVHIRHGSEDPTSIFYTHSDNFSFKEMVAPIEGEKIITKNVHSAFLGTDLEQYMDACDPHSVVITGLTTPHCISTTTRISKSLGYLTYVLSDATAAFGLTDHLGDYQSADRIHHFSLATLHEEFAIVVTTEQFITSYLSS